MQLLGAWFEDMHFNAVPSISVSPSVFRAAYARGAIGNMSSPNRGIATFSATSDLWVSGRIYVISPNSAHRYMGVMGSSTAAESGIFVGASSTTSRLSVYLANNGVYTSIASEASSSLPGAILRNIVLRITGTGALSSCRIRVYTDSSVDPVIDWSGDASIPGVSAIDSFAIGRAPGQSYFYLSECMATDEDPRAWGLKTLAPTGAGDSNTANSGTYADVDEITLNDVDKVVLSAAGQEIDVAVTDLPSGAFAVAGVIASARVTDPDQTVPIAVGVRSGGTTYSGSVTLPPTSWGLMQTIYNTNPNTSAPWTVSNVNGLQLVVRS